MAQRDINLRGYKRQAAWEGVHQDVLDWCTRVIWETDWVCGGKGLNKDLVRWAIG